VSIGNLAAELARWKAILTAAANAFPSPQADRARQLLVELSTALTPLDSEAPASSNIAAAAALADRLRADNPLGQWLLFALPKLAPVLGSALPPLGLALGIAAIGARLGEDAYRRWVANVLQTPFSPGLIEPQAVTSTMVLAALEVSPEFGAAWNADRAQGDLAAITDMGRLLLEDPERLWAQESARFGADRVRFDRGLQEMRRALLGQAVAADTGSITRAELPEEMTPAQILGAVSMLQPSPEGKAILQTAVQLIHEMRNEGVSDPVGALRAAAVEGKIS
jgi:hypothetical protein